MRLHRLLPAAAAAALSCALIAQAPAPATSAPASSAPASSAPAPTAPTAAAGGDPVVARVNGEEIHLSDVAAAVQSLPAQYRGMPAASLFPMMIDQLVDQKALVAMARKEGVDQDPAVRKQIARAEEQALQTAEITRVVGPLVSEPAIHARYDRDIAGKPGETEVHARHILVASEDEAKKIIAELQAGGDFVALAKAHSTDPGGAQGGDLGFFKKGDMLPGFSEVAFSLKPGEISPTPAHTQYGWHVVQVLEVRQAPAETYETAHDALRQEIIQDGLRKLLADARAGAQIQKYNPDGTAPRATDDAEPPPAPGQSGKSGQPGK